MEYKESDFLQISGLQHFSFCRRQWALIHIENQWNENLYTAEGEINHKRVHDTNNTDLRNGIYTIRGLNIKSVKLGISGTCDAVEFIPSEDGIVLNKKNGLWKIMPVEYKHGKSKTNDCDRLQAAAQAMCLEEMFCCEIKEASLFYNGTKRRQIFKVDGEMRTKVISMLEEMHDYYNRGYTPFVRQKRECKSCSLSDICLPVLEKKRKKQNVRQYIDSHLGDDLQ